MKNEIKNWQHVFKLDPAKSIKTMNLERICESGTDAIIVGGTDDVTFDGVSTYFIAFVAMLSSVLEISNNEAITPGFDYYFIPTVLNSKDKKWIMDIQHEAIKQYSAYDGLG